MSIIKEIKARQILDSRGIPTVECDVLLENGGLGRASVPSGASTGKHEDLELRDGDKNIYQGRSVFMAVENVNTKIKGILLGQDARNQKNIDKLMLDLDGTLNESNLGANAILAVSLAVMKAAADGQKIPLYEWVAYIFGYKGVFEVPTPTVNVLNGGAHADSDNYIQEIMLVPKGFDEFRKKLQASAEVFYSLKDILKEKGGDTNVGDEGGFAPAFEDPAEAIDTLVESIQRAGYIPGKDFFIALDVAASEFYKDGTYVLGEGSTKSSMGMIEMYKYWLAKYPMVFIEDGLDQDDWSGWVEMTKALGKETILVGDDLFVTNSGRLKMGLEKGVANAIIIKPNQVGSVSEMFETVELAQKNRYMPIISHRSGETLDTCIVDLAVGMGIKYIKAGSLSRGERIAKYNRMSEIEEELKIK